MKKVLALAIALVLLTICIPRPSALASTNPNDFIGTWYPLFETDAGILINNEGCYTRPTYVINADNTAYVYEDDFADPWIIDWFPGTGAYAGMIYTVTGRGRTYYKMVDGIITDNHGYGEIFSMDILPAGGRFRTDAALADFDGSWVFSYAVANGMRMSIQEFYASRLGFILQMGEGFVMNALTIDNGRVTDTGSERGRTFEFDHSFGRLTAKLDEDIDHTYQNLMVFTLHESGLMRYNYLLSTIYYQREYTPEPTPEPTPLPSEEPEPMPSPKPTPEPMPTPEETPLPSDEPEPTPELGETPPPSVDPEPPPVNNNGGNGGPNWLIIAFVALAVVAVGVIVTSIIVWKKKT